MKKTNKLAKYDINPEFQILMNDWELDSPAF